MQDKRQSNSTGSRQAGTKRSKASSVSARPASVKSEKPAEKTPSEIKEAPVGRKPAEIPVKIVKKQETASGAKAAPSEKSRGSKAPAKRSDAVAARTAAQRAAARERLKKRAELKAKEEAEASANEKKSAASATEKPAETRVKKDNVVDFELRRRPAKKKKKAKKKPYVLNKAPKQEEKEAKKTDRRHLGAALALGAILLAAGAFVALFLISKVKTISVTGNERFSSAEIVNLSKLYTGRNLFVYDLDEAKKNIETNPYLDCLTIQRIFPSELNIQVAERKEFAAIASTGGLRCVIDAEGNVLDVRKDGFEGLIPVYGMGSMGYTTGTNIAYDRSKLRPYTLIELFKAIGDRSFRIASIDISNSANIKILTDSGVLVQLGDSDNVAKKIEYMFNALEKVDGTKLEGTVIYINSNGTADISYPKPETTPEPSPTPEPSSTDEPDSTEEP